MGIVDGNPVNAAYTNPIFIKVNDDDSKLAKLTLADVDTVGSGNSITNAQKELNSVSYYLGRTTNGSLTTLPSFTNNQGFGADSIFVRLDSVSGKFHNSSGHAHTGNPGDGPQIQSNTIASVPLQSYPTQGTTITGASGNSTNVSSLLSGKTPSSTQTSPGVVVNNPYNFILLAQGSGTNTGDKIVDGSGNAVYGRLTFASSVWTLTYYVNIGGTETPYSLPSQDVMWFYQELFNPLNNPPVYSPLFLIPSDNATADVMDATTSQRGLVNTTSQSFAGAKTFVGDLIAQAKMVGDVAVDSSTTGSNAALPSPSKLVDRVTNASLTSISTITGGSQAQVFVLINNTGSTVTVKNYTGTNGIYTGTGLDFDFHDGAAILLVYITALSGWVMTGGGGGANTQLSNLTTTNINQNLLFNAANVYNIGDATNYLQQIYASLVNTNTISSLTGVSMHISSNGDIVLGFGGGGNFLNLQNHAIQNVSDPSNNQDAATKNYVDTNVKPTLTGSRGSPQNITAVGGIAFSSTKEFNEWYIQGSGGAVTVTANPQIAAGSFDGQKLMLIGRSDTNTVTLQDGTGLSLNGTWVGGADSILELRWDGTNWVERGRSA